jgi:glycosyltransferase involved in cell wall biosynthesis
MARTILGLAPEKKVVAVCSASLDDHRKGVGFALNALASCRALNPAILMVGQVSFPVEQHLSGLNYTLAGFVTDRTRLGLLYAAADLLLFPSLADNLPITIQEAMAAGTPVLAFAVGGVPELIRPGRTGWLVTAGDQPALNRQLREILEADDTSKYGDSARTMIQKEFSVAGCVNQHEALYRSSLAVAAAPGKNQ